jgi:hypothetical protein
MNSTTPSAEVGITTRIATIDLHHVACDVTHCAPAMLFWIPSSNFHHIVAKLFSSRRDCEPGAWQVPKLAATQAVWQALRNDLWCSVVPAVYTIAGVRVLMSAEFASCTAEILPSMLSCPNLFVATIQLLVQHQRSIRSATHPKL